MRLASDCSEIARSFKCESGRPVNRQSYAKLREAQRMLRCASPCSEATSEAEDVAVFVEFVASHAGIDAQAETCQAAFKTKIAAYLAPHVVAQGAGQIEGRVRSGGEPRPNARFVARQVAHERGVESR